ncbi:MAG: hypothetical protein OER77_00200 [Myxococcales bacterium]|nr:hypothetical protein [Myxococcales bacterium]
MTEVSFKTVVDELLNTVRERTDWVQSIEYDPSRKVASTGQVLIGVGRWGTAEKPEHHAGICLNNKGVGERFGPDYAYSSVTKLVLDPPEEIWEAWMERAGEPKTFLQRTTLVVEDISADSCIALICFIARISGVLPSEIPKRWVEAARSWEEGHIPMGDPRRSWGVLHTALGHGLADRDSIQERSETGDKYQECVKAGWRSCLGFDLSQLIVADRDPHNIPTTDAGPEHGQALALLEAEHQLYLQGLRGATILQLSVPLKAGGGRDMLLDTYIATEQVPLGAAKVFLSNDLENSPSGQGFGLTAVHRPGFVGTGNETTIVVGPSRGTTLEELWFELERLENEQWGDQRPKQNPRKVKGYPRAENGKQIQGFDEPWWDCGGSYNLLGAPRDNQSRLTWPEVVDAIWRVYNPTRDIQVWNARKKDGESKTCRLLECAADFHELDVSNDVSERNGKKGITVAHWQSHSRQALLLTPTVLRTLAALAARSDGRKEISVDDLPPESEFDRIDFSGGCAVVHAKGVCLLNDWRAEDLDVECLRDEVKACVKLVQEVRDQRRKLDKLSKKLGEIGKRGPSKPLNLLEGLASVKADILKALTENRTRSEDASVREFRDVLERRWGIAKELESLHDITRDLEETVRNYSQLRANWMIDKLAIYGFPAVLLAGFFQFVTSGADWGLTLPLGNFTIDIPNRWHGISVPGLLGYLAVTLLFILLLNFLIRRRDSQPVPDISKLDADKQKARRRKPWQWFNHSP